MNLLPLILLIVYFGKIDFATFKNILPKLDLPSFLPVFKLLGMDEKTISLLVSDKFSETLKKISENDFTDIKSLIPVFAELMSSAAHSRESDEKEQPQEKKAAEAANVNAAYFTPVKEIIPDDVSEMFSEYFH